jgi:organic radical activating enzyme
MSVFQNTSKKENSDPTTITTFIECLIPITACNMKCHYCYVAQRGQNKATLPKMKYSPETIGKALSKNRLKGNAYISMCGAGETLLVREITEILFAILKEGHYANITTNGTISEKFDEIINVIPKHLLEHLHFSFSLHYLELLRLNKLDHFFKNVKRIRENGCSFIIQINLCDEYEPFLEEIKEIVFAHTNAYPQVAATRDELNLKKDVRLYTKHTQLEYENIGKSFASPLFQYTMKNFMVKRKEFCYAGNWSYVLNMETGILKPCYASREKQNIFKNIYKPIKLHTVGNHCGSAFCMNSSHFMAWGVIPELEHPTYADLRNRNCQDASSWYSKTMLTTLNQNLETNNKPYTPLKKTKTNIYYYYYLILRYLPIDIAKYILRICRIK